MFFQNVALGVLVEKTIKSAKYYNVKQVMIAGGVSANSKLREDLIKACQDHHLDLVLPPLWCCTDNAAMIAMAGSFMYDLKEFSSLDLGVKPNIEL